MAADPLEIVGPLKAALSALRWREAEVLCHGLADAIRRSPRPFPESEARAILAQLRRKRRFPLMEALADACIQSGQRLPELRRQYAQSLIDQGRFTAALAVLDDLSQDATADPDEAAARAVTMICEGRVRAASGAWVTLRPDTICLHGDGPTAVPMARTIRRAMDEAGVAVRALWAE